MERYRQEMMRLYGKSTSKNDTVPVKASEAPPEKNNNPAPEEKEKIIPESFHETREANQEIPPEKNPEPLQTEPEPQKSGIDERYPDPVLDEIMQNPHTKFNDNEYNKRNNYDSIGWISVNVRTGENSSPVEGASVIVTSMADGNLIFKATGITDESGQIKKIALPAPSVNLSLDSANLIKPYSVYDISVYADGFFRERSIDVPVFAGITSIQQFNMVPLPLYMTEDDETINYYNQEPELQ